MKFRSRCCPKDIWLPTDLQTWTLIPKLISQKPFRMRAGFYEAMAQHCCGISKLSPRPLLGVDTVCERAYFNNARPESRWCLIGRKNRGEGGPPVSLFLASISLLPFFSCTQSLPSHASAQHKFPAELFFPSCLYTLKARKHSQTYPQCLSPPWPGADRFAELVMCQSWHYCNKTSCKGGMHSRVIIV